MHRHNFILSALLISFFFSLSADAFAGWESGAKAGFDSNIDRAVEGGMSDSFVTGFLSFTKEPVQDSNPGWTLDLSLEGAGYKESSCLNYGMATLSPAIIFYPHPRWNVSLSPFFHATAVKDAEQSAVAFGGEININQAWNQAYYTGEYIFYTDSRADIEIYSYKEKTAGIFAGVNWTDAFWSEIGYEFSRGDSFRAVGEVLTTRIGKGKSRRYSQAYHEYIISEPVGRHTISVNMGCQFTSHIFSFINYAYSSYKGDAGTSESHTGDVGIGYQF